MSESLHAYLRRSAALIETSVEALPEATMTGAIAACVEALRGGKPVLVCGNGGSAADAMHITGELVGRFLKERRALKAICAAKS